MLACRLGTAPWYQESSCFCCSALFSSPPDALDALHLNQQPRNQKFVSAYLKFAHEKTRAIDVHARVILNKEGLESVELFQNVPGALVINILVYKLLLHNRRIVVFIVTSSNSLRSPCRKRRQQQPPHGAAQNGSLQRSMDQYCSFGHTHIAGVCILQHPQESCDTNP